MRGGSDLQVVADGFGDWRIDPSTRRAGIQGIAEARAVLDRAARARVGAGNVDAA
ncbi:MAG: hypothetical protein ACYDD6_09260 [Acidimicrobiales bacterium]